MAAENVQLQVEIPFEQLLAFVERFSPEQKQVLYEKLRMDSFRLKWEQLASKIQSPGFTEEDILNEVKKTRQERHAANR
ncbi:MAG: hypothetical protein WCR52_21790 [Bacteroidota bacterium]